MSTIERSKTTEFSKKCQKSANYLFNEDDEASQEYLLWKRLDIY
jgi:hypothetical protein